MSKYETWIKEEKKWIKDYQRKIKLMMILKVVPATIIILGMVNALIALGDGEDVIAALTTSLPLAIVFCLLFAIAVVFALRPSKYIRVIKYSLDELGMDDNEKELFASEMLDININQWRCLSFTYDGHGSAHTPARFRITPHYVFLQGSNPYAVVVRLSDIQSVKKADDREKQVYYTTKNTGGKRTHARNYEYFELYAIHFYKKTVTDSETLPDYKMGFYDETVRDEAFELIKKQTSM